MVAELVEPITLPDAENGTKRGRGRPPSLNPDGTRKNAPKISKPKAAKRAKAAATKPRGSRSLKAELSAFLTMTNTLLILSPLGTRPAAAILDPTIVPEKIGDELDTYEIDALAGALDRQCSRSPRFRRYVERMLTAGAGGQLVTVLGIIATRRAARHGLIPNGKLLDPMLGMMLANGDVSALGDMPDSKPDTTPDATTGEMPPDRNAEPEGFDFENIGTFAEP